jgi:hypothetical protein
MPGTIDAAITALELIKEIFAALHKDEADRFQAEWEKDEQTILKALQDGDAFTLNAMRAKFMRPLL